MSFRLEFDRTKRTLLASFTEPFTDADLRKAQDGVAQIIETYGPCSGITDLSSLTEFMVSTNLVRELAYFRAKQPEQCTEVVLATRDLIFGMARMYQMLTDRPNVHVVRSIEDAYTLLDATAPEFMLAEVSDSSSKMANK
jgi:hypothetical protein